MFSKAYLKATTTFNKLSTRSRIAIGVIVLVIVYLIYTNYTNDKNSTEHFVSGSPPVKTVMITNKYNNTQPIQIAQLAVYSIINGTEINIAKTGSIANPIATASPAQYGSNINTPIDGTLSPRNHPNQYHSISELSAWTVTFDKPYNISYCISYYFICLLYSIPPHGGERNIQSIFSFNIK